MEEIDLKEIMETFLEKKAIIILTVAIFVIMGFLYTTYILVPEYTSETTLVLAQTASNEENEEGITTTDITLNSKLISTYSKLVKSTSVIRTVKTNLGIEDSEESLKSNVSVKAEENSEILKITATNTDPEKAKNIANETAEVFTKKIKELYKIDNIHTVDLAETNKMPSNVNHMKDMIIFAIIGLIISMGYILVMYMLDNSVKSQEDIEKSMDLTVLANIPVYEAEKIKNKKRGKRKKARRRR